VPLGDPITDRTAVVLAGVGSPGVALVFQVKCVVVTGGTAGDVKLQFAQNNDDPGITVAIKAGSWIFAQRIS
jgi:hypothetical protein